MKMKKASFQSIRVLLPELRSGLEMRGLNGLKIISWV